MFQDRTLICKTCGKPFLFSADEQAFLASKGFTQSPAFCMECRAARKKAAYAAALQDPSKRYHYRCTRCSRVFVSVHPLVKDPNATVLCTECVPPNVPIYNDDDRMLNKALGFPRHMG